jgi:AraC-like DNA-binding protein
MAVLFWYRSGMGIVHGGDEAGLERLSADGRARIRTRTKRPGFTQMDAQFHGLAFAPHRHDAYSIGVTVQGVQAFGYRGAQAHSLPGQVFVLHPDELHDGRAGTAEGYGYRGLSLAPALIQAALDGAALPFVRDAVPQDGPLRAAILAAVDDDDFSDLHFDQIIQQLADALAAQDSTPRALRAPHRRAATLARAYLDEHLQSAVDSATLEALTGLTRFALTRHFRACFGTSPHRYVVMRRLERVRAMIEAGAPLAAAAVDSGFADQSHMTRHFRKAYGFAPGRWSRMVAA